LIVARNYLTYHYILRIITVVVCDFCINNWLFRRDVNLQTIYFVHSLQWRDQADYCIGDNFLRERGKGKFITVNDELDIALLQVEFKVMYVFNSFQGRDCTNHSSSQEIVDEWVEFDRYVVDLKIGPKIPLYFAPPGL